MTKWTNLIFFFESSKDQIGTNENLRTNLFILEMKI